MTEILDRAEIERFRLLVAERLGLRFEDDKLDFLSDILRQRIEQTRSESALAYLQGISGSSAPQEMRIIAEQITVCETYFFRYADHFRAFTEVVLPDRMRSGSRRRQLRILSAGSSSGEEAYSLAILIRDRFPDLASWEVTIQGIDINAAIVGKALRARYPAWSLRDTPIDLRARYFRAEGREFILESAAKTMVTFEERNMVRDDALFWRAEAFDIVFCRNVIMYFTPEAARSVITRIAQSLTPGGFLFLGHAETLRGISQEFHLRHTHETFYYQRREAHESLCDYISPQSAIGHGAMRSPVPAVIDSNDSWFDIIHRASERITQLTEGKGRTESAGLSNKAIPSRNPDVFPGHHISQERRSIQIPVEQPTPAWNQTLAIDLMRQERFAEAIELLRALPPESKADPDAQLLLAALLTNRGDLPEAEKVCQHLLVLDELNAGAHYLMALCKEHGGDAAAAAEHDQAAVYLDPAFAMPHLHLGLVAKRLGNVKAAQRELERAMSLLAREDTSRVLLFGGGFSREALTEFCKAELYACGEPS